MKTQSALLIMVAILLCLFILGGIDKVEQEKAQSTYCYMTELWEEEAKLNIDPEHRMGWPAFDGECDDRN